MRLSIATPCPVDGSRFDALKHTKEDETTANLDFTTTFRASFRDVKPRRRQSAVKFTIHEDEEFKSSGTENLVGPMLEQPARRPTAQHITVPAESDAAMECISRANRRISGISVPPKRRKSTISNPPDVIPIEQPGTGEPDNTLTIARPARRKSIFIPADDTTMPSLYMGIFSPVKNVHVLSPRQEGLEQEIEVTGIAACMLEKKRRRVSTIGQRARRVPLQTRTLRQEVQAHHDHPGAQTGKENIPPGVSKANAGPEATRKSSSSSWQQRSSVYQAPADVAAGRPLRRSTFAAPTTSQLSKKSELQKRDQDLGCSGLLKTQNKRAWNAGSHSKPNKPAAVKYEALHKAVPNSTKKERLSVQCKVPNRFITPLVESRAPIIQHKLLTEHINHPALYEEDWLDHQELAVMHLVNDLFRSAQQNNATNSTSSSMRSRLLDLYNQPEINILHKRLQAALLYGALSMPQEIADGVKNLQYDIGRRKAFIDFWQNTYNVHVLETALEVVVGRQLHLEQQFSEPPTSLHKTNKRSEVRQFIEAFIIRNDDHLVDLTKAGTSLNQSQRTVLRSLMLIKILDLSAADSDDQGRSCLFLKDSSHKSSTTALQALVKMLNPAMGDAIRALRHLGFELSYEQPFLQEFEYNIGNLATDLRDGVRLTRLAELLLYPSTFQCVEVVNASETSTIFMPEGETVEVRNSQHWPLSTHLKFPCVGRATKLWNAQIALGALKNVAGVEQLIQDVTAEDIVDGFREKTMRLLWSLVGRWGLAGLLDWQDVKWELKRQLRKDELLSVDTLSDEEGDDHSDSKNYEHLLKKWARAVAHSRGIPLNNFTTSFSDGKVFAAILDEYEPYLTQGKFQSKKSLQERLCNLGCSKHFSELFPTNIQGTCHIFSKDFVLAALAFLCSRLLGPSKSCRSAVVIQRVWRRHWAMVEKKRKVEKKQLAMACAELVENKNKPESNRAADSDITVEAHTGMEEDIWLSLK